MEADPEGEQSPREKPKEQRGLPAQKGQWKFGGQQYAGSLMKVVVPLGGFVSSHTSVRCSHLKSRCPSTAGPRKRPKLN